MAAMSERDAITLTNAKQACSIDNGVADVFVRADSGTLVPLVSLTAPTKVPGTDGVTLLVVPRIEASLTPAEAGNKSDYPAYYTALGKEHGYAPGSDLGDFYQQTIQDYFTQRKNISQKE